MNLPENTNNTSTLAENIATVCHNMNGQLAIILGFAGLAGAGDPVAVARRFASIETAARNIHLMVQTMAAMGRGTYTPRPLLRQPLQQLWADAHPSLAALCARANVSLSMSPAPICLLRMDRSELRQVLEVLVDNAARATNDLPSSADRRGVVSVSAVQVHSHTLHIEIQDRGVGMDADAISRFMLGLRPQQVRGHGLGLVFVRQAVRRHGGNVAITSQPGGGTTIRINLPIA